MCAWRKGWYAHVVCRYLAYVAMEPLGEHYRPIGGDYIIYIINAIILMVMSNLFL